MTRYARRDAVLVAVSPHLGGCGASHSRPVTHGVPDKNWELNCPRCEKALDNDPLWAKTRAEIPETPDETTHRESLKNQKDRNLEEIQTFAMAKMAGMDIDTDFQQGPIRGQQVVCRNGHQNPASSRFCSECGSSLSLSDTGIMSIPEPAGSSNGNGHDDYTHMPVSRLRELATERGISPSQSKKDLVAALSS